MLFPGEGYTNSNFEAAHFLTTASDPQGQYIPQVYYFRNTNKYFLKSNSGEYIELK